MSGLGIQFQISAIDNFSSVMNDLDRQVSGIGKIAGNLGKAVGAMAVAAGAATAAVGAGIGKVGIDYNRMMEQSAIAWETILGDANKAKKTIEELETMGAKTPFEFEGLDKAAKLLNMAGFEGDKLFTTLTSVGDAVSAVGGGQAELEGVSMAIFQMASKGKISAEEMNQLAERGIPAWQMMADSMGKSVPELMKMSEQGKLFAKDVLPQLVDGMGKKFGGAMEKQSATFNGQMSTMTDNAKILAGVMTEDLFGKLTSIMPKANELLQQFTAGFKEGGLAGALQNVLPPSVFAKFEALKETFSQVKTVAFDVFNTVKTIATPIIAEVVSFVGDKIGQMRKFFDENGAQIVQAVKNMWEIMKSIFTVVAPVLLFIVKSLWENVKGVINGAINIIIGIIKVFTGIFTLDFRMMWEGVKSLFVGALQFLWNLINLMLVGKAISGIKAFVSKGVTAFKDLAVKSKDLVVKIVDDIAGFFKGLGDDMIGYGKNIVDGLINGIKAKISSLIDTAKSIADTVTSTIRGALDINSPSRIMMEVGGYVGQGFSIGLGDQINAIKAASRDMATAAIPSAPYQSRVASPAASQQQTAQRITVEVPLYLDSREIARSTVDDISKILYSKARLTARVNGFNY